jgi:hypothetical protein
LKGIPLWMAVHVSTQCWPGWHESHMLGAWLWDGHWAGTTQQVPSTGVSGAQLPVSRAHEDPAAQGVVGSQGGAAKQGPGVEAATPRDERRQSLK